MRLHATEKEEQAAIVDLLETLGAKVYVLGTKRPKGDYPGACQTPGVPDLIVFLPKSRVLQAEAHHLYIEVKTPKGRMSDEQFVFRDNCQRANVSHIYGGVDQVTAWLERFGYLKSEKRA